MTTMIPKPTQLSGAQFLAERNYALLADLPRVGKTGAAIIAADYRMAESILVVTTASGRGVWKAGLAAWSSFDRKVQVLTGGKALRPDTDVAIVGWGGLTQPKLRAELLKRRWSVAMLDEAHAAKNFEAKRTQAVYGTLVDDGADLNTATALTRTADVVWLLTGTPLPNSPADAYPMLRALFPERLTTAFGPTDVTTFSAFMKRYCKTRPMKVGHGYFAKWIDVFVEGVNLDELNARISDAIRGFIIAAPGHEFVQADYSNIEGNVIAWSANEEWKLKAIHELNADPSLPDMYRRTAAAILGLTTEEVTKKHWARQAVGKPAELGLAYGGGVMAFVTFAKAYGVKLDSIAANIIAQADEGRIEKATKRYEGQVKRGLSGTTELPRDAWIACEIVKLGWRTQNAAIAQSWKDLENAVREAVASPGQIVGAAKVDYLFKNGFLWARLPSGRCLAYGTPKLKAQVWAKVKLDDGSWSDSEVMDKETAEIGERKGTVKIEGSTSDKVTVLGVDSKTKKWRRYGLYGGLLAENCLSAETEVLTAVGWKRIVDIRNDDQIWDGLTWVSHSGVIAQGLRGTINFNGVRMTPEHKVWTNDGWKAAISTNIHEAAAASPDPEHDRRAVRAAGGDRLCGRRRAQDLVEGPLLMRHREVVRRSGVAQGQDPELRVLPRRGSEAPGNDPRAVAAQMPSRLVEHDRPLHQSEAQGLRALWRAGYHGLRSLADIVSEFLGRHGRNVARRLDLGATGQQRWLQPSELRLAGPDSASTEQAQQHGGRHTGWSDADLRGRRGQRDQRDDAVLSDRRRLAEEAPVRPAGCGAQDHVEPVFDILNAGPRNRFTVRAPDGTAFIVSNCTQAIARDILVNGMFKAEAAGYPIIATVYDEILAEVPIGYGNLAEFERLICDLPEWAQGIPLVADGYRSKRYKK